MSGTKRSLNPSRLVVPIQLALASAGVFFATRLPAGNPCCSPAGPKIALAFGYPTEALRKRHEGRVIVSFEITPEGSTIHCQVASSSGHQTLDRVVCPVVERRARFEPLRQNGVATDTKEDWPQTSGSRPDKLLKGHIAHLGFLESSGSGRPPPRNCPRGWRSVRSPGRR